MSGHTINIDDLKNQLYRGTLLLYFHQLLPVISHVKRLFHRIDNITCSLCKCPIVSFIKASFYSLSWVDWNGIGVVSSVIPVYRSRFQQSYPKYCNSPNHPFIPSLLHVDHSDTLLS